MAPTKTVAKTKPNSAKRTSTNANVSPNSYAVTKLTATEEAKITALVKKAVR